MQAGKINRRITIEQRVEVDDGGGGKKITWQPFATVWASITPSTGREVYQSDQVRAELWYDIKIRYRAGVKSSMRVNYNGRLFNIRNVRDIEERHFEMMLKCEELQAF